MSELQLFNFQDNQVRVVEIDSNPWFVAKDISDILEYSETSKMLVHVDEDDKRSINPKQSPDLVGSFSNTVTSVAVINESGLYSAIFSSTKPEAKLFRKWVTSEVLPAVRKQGYYVSNTEDVLLSAIAELTKSVTQIKTDYSDQVKYLIESNVVKDEQITQLNNQHNALQEVLNLYPGLDKALQEFQLIEETTESFPLKDYLLDHGVNLDRGQRIRVGQIINGWLNLSQQQPLFKLNGNSLYTAKHIPLIKLAIEYIFGWN